MDNGVYRAPGDRCLLSPRPAALADPRGARTAIDYFTKALARRPGDVELTWLLNLAHMAAGSYPAGVPAAALDSARGVRVGREHRPLRRRGAALGVDSFSSAGGVIVDDFDNDGALDILTSNFDSCGAMQLFRRGADGRFHDQAARAGLAGELGGLNLLQADYDNDGCIDVLVLRGGWELPQRKSLLRNNCEGTFTDVTAASGLAIPATSTQTAAWADVDNDGFARPLRRQREPAGAAVQEQGQRHLRGHRPRGRRGPGGVHQGRGRRRLRQRRRRGPVRVESRRRQLPVSQQRQPHVHRGGGRGRRAGPERGFATWFFDYDNDGWDDLLVSSYFSRSTRPRGATSAAPNATTMKLYRNRGDGTFADVTAQVGLDRVFMPMGSNFGDVDNDGYPDIYLGTGSPSYGATVRSRAAAQPRGPDVRGHHGVVGHGRIAQGARRGVRRPRQRRRSGHRVQSRRRHARRRARVPPVRQPRPRQRLARPGPGGQEQIARPLAHASPSRCDADGCDAHGASHGDARRLVRRVAAAAAHRPRHCAVARRVFRPGQWSRRRQRLRGR